jgi:hypothetical protein
MSDSDFEEFEEPEEPEILEDGPIVNKDTENPKQERREEIQTEEVKDEKIEETTDKVQETDKNKKENSVKEESKKEIDKKKNPSVNSKNEEETQIKKEDQNVVKTPEKKTKNTVSSAQKPNSIFHPVSQDSDINLNSKLSESFSMITHDAKGEEQSGMDLISECRNMISPNNQIEKKNVLEESQSVKIKSETQESKKKDSGIQKSEKNLFLTKFPLLGEWSNETEEKGATTSSIYKVKETLTKSIKGIEKGSKISSKKSLLGRFKKLKIYKKLVQMKEEIQNNSCKEMKGLNKKESELLNEFLDGLYFLPDSVNKDLFEI